MPAPNVFIDTNILLYLLSADTAKADCAETIVRSGGLISVQVLNEMAHVTRRKFAMPWADVNEVLAMIRSLCTTAPLTIETHDRGRLVAERYGLGIYDAMILAAALIGGCEILYSEDMQDGQAIDHQLRICNPFNIQNK
ncbi:MAG: PIN domain-containing protein [Thermodesulfobacteriota bacterium]